MAAKATKQKVPNKNLPEVSKQTAGGIGGAMLGGMVAGPVGALIGGVAGALVGKSSAEGKEPIKKTVASVREKVRTSKSAQAAIAKLPLTDGKPKPTAAKSSAAKSKPSKATPAKSKSSKSKPAASTAAKPTKKKAKSAKTRK